MRLYPNKTRKMVAMKRQGFKAWAIAAHYGVSVEDVMHTLAAAGYKRANLAHPQERKHA